MKKITACLFLIFLLTACDVRQTQPSPVWTPIPSRTPGVITATPTIAPTFTPAPPPTETPIPEPKEGDTKTDTLANGKEVTLTYHVVTDAEGKEVYRGWFYDPITGPFYWVDYDGHKWLPIRFHLAWSVPGVDRIDSINIGARDRDSNFELTTRGSLKERIMGKLNLTDAEWQDYLNYMNGKPSSIKGITYTARGKEYAFNPRNGADIYVLPNTPEIVNNYEFTQFHTGDNKTFHLAANLGNEINKSIKTVFVLIKPVNEFTDKDWREFLMVHMASLLVKKDQTKITFTGQSGTLAIGAKTFIQIIWANSVPTPTATP